MLACRWSNGVRRLVVCATLAIAVTVATGAFGAVVTLRRLAAVPFSIFPGNLEFDVYWASASWFGQRGACAIAIEPYSGHGELLSAEALEQMMNRSMATLMRLGVVDATPRFARDAIEARVNAIEKAWSGDRGIVVLTIGVPFRWACITFVADATVGRTTVRFDRLRSPRLSVGVWQAGASFGIVWACLFLVSSGAAVFVRRRRNLQGLCERCRYPVHGMRGARCPECGQPVART
jgi:hypothetical protein